MTQLRDLNLVGKKFQCLTVLRKAPMKFARTQWLCECECGQGTRITTAGKLLGTLVNDCGCGIWRNVRKIGRPRSHAWVIDNTLKEPKAEPGKRRKYGSYIP